MDLGKIQYFERAEKKHQQDYIRLQNNCILCCTPLELQHVRNDECGEIKEEAHCPHCEVKTRAKIYTLN